MKNSALAKKATMAGCPRTAMKMQTESAMKAMSKSPAEMETPAKAMQSPAKAMDAPTKAMTKSPAEFNAKLRKAKAEGKLNPKFAAVVKKKDDEMKRLLKIRRNTDPNNRDAMREIDMKIREHARKMGVRNVPDEETGGPRKPKKKAPLEMESPMKEMMVKKKSSLDPRMDRGRDSMRGRKKSDLRERDSNKKDPSLEYKLGKFGGERGTTLTSVSKTNKKTTTPPSKDNYQTTIDKKRKEGIGYKTTYKKDQSGKVIESGITFDDGTYLRD